MELQGYFTKKGLELAAKLASGAALKITRVTAGAGRTGNPSAAVSLPQPRQNLAVNSPIRRGNTAILPVTLTAALADGAFGLTELGVFAQDPQEGEILYKLYKMPETVEIKPTSCLVLRFYLEETVSQDLGAVVACSPAGLITEADFAPVRDKVEKRALPYRTVSLEAAGLQNYLDSLPRLLAENLTLSVTGTLGTAVELRHFYGPGHMQIYGGEGFTLRNIMRISECQILMNIHTVEFQERKELTSNDALLDIRNCGGTVSVTKCGFTGLGGAERCVGVLAAYGSRAVVTSCRASGLGTAVQASRGSAITIDGDLSGYADNAVGAHVWHGGMVLLTSPVPDTLGAPANRKYGGLIVNTKGEIV